MNSRAGFSDSTGWATATTPLRAFDVGLKNDSRSQTKLWSYGGKTWAIIPGVTGTWLWRLEDRSWRAVLKISSLTNVQTSVTVKDNMVHIVMLNGTIAYIAHLDYVVGSNEGYRLWPGQSTLKSVSLGSGVEIATLAKDSIERLWLASDTGNRIVIRYSSPPYRLWSNSITVATGVGISDIASVISLPNNSVGVFWSNQIRKEFGFRIHQDSALPARWEAPQNPGNGLSPSVGNGLSDSHFNLAVSKDGRLFAAVKTRFNSSILPQIALLVRSPEGNWDPVVYKVDTRGSRPAIALDELNDIVRVAYASYQVGGEIYLSEARLSDLTFSERRVVATGNLNNPTFIADSGDGNSTLLAFEGNRAFGFLLKTSVQEQDVLIQFRPEETPSQTTTRIQEAIDVASAHGSGIRFESAKIFDLDRELKVRFPGPRFIDGGFSTLRRLSAGGAVLNVDSAQDGILIRDLNILGSAGDYSEDGYACNATWAHAGADFGIVLGDTRWATLRNVTIWNAAISGIKLQPIRIENDGTLIQSSSVRFSGDGIQILGTASNRVRSTQIKGTTINFSKNFGLVTSYADDLQMHGGSIEKAMLDLIKIEDSNRIQLLTYTENFGGYLWNPTGNGSWCPRNSNGNSIEISRSSHVFFRGRNGEEKDRDNLVGPAVLANQTNCYQVVTKGSELGGNCQATAIARPLIRPRFEAYSESFQLSDSIVISPEDEMAVVISKIRDAARYKLGIQLQPGGVYQWGPIEMRYISNTPISIDGRGATIDFVGTGQEVEAALKFIQPSSLKPIGRDRFTIQDLTINLGSRAKYGILIQGSLGAFVRRVTVNGAATAGFKNEGKPGAGFYYSHFLDCKVTNSPIGLEIQTTDYSKGKYSNANLVDNFITTDVGTVYNLSWTASTHLINTTAQYTSRYNGPKKLLNANYSSDIELYGALLGGQIPTNSSISYSGWSPGIYIDLAR